MNSKKRKKIREEVIDTACRREAENFFYELKDNVQIYKKIRKLDNFKQDKIADKFVAWWELERYAKHPHALILLYENMNRINEFIGSYNPLDGFRQLQIKLILLYKYLQMYEMDK